MATPLRTPGFGALPHGSECTVTSPHDSLAWGQQQQQSSGGGSSKGYFLQFEAPKAAFSARRKRSQSAGSRSSGADSRLADANASTPRTSSSAVRSTGIKTPVVDDSGTTACLRVSRSSGFSSTSSKRRREDGSSHGSSGSRVLHSNTRANATANSLAVSATAGQAERHRQKQQVPPRKVKSSPDAASAAPKPPQLLNASIDGSDERDSGIADGKTQTASQQPCKGDDSIVPIDWDMLADECSYLARETLEAWDSTAGEELLCNDDHSAIPYWQPESGEQGDEDEEVAEVMVAAATGVAEATRLATDDCSTRGRGQASQIIGNVVGASAIVSASSPEHMLPHSMPTASYCTGELDVHAAGVPSTAGDKADLSNINPMLHYATKFPEESTIAVMLSSAELLHSIDCHIANDTCDQSDEKYDCAKSHVEQVYSCTNTDCQSLQTSFNLPPALGCFVDDLAPASVEHSSALHRTSTCHAEMCCALPNLVDCHHIPHVGIDRVDAQVQGSIMAASAVISATSHMVSPDIQAIALLSTGSLYHQDGCVSSVDATITVDPTFLTCTAEQSDCFLKVPFVNFMTTSVTETEVMTTESTSPQTQHNSTSALATATFIAISDFQAIANYMPACSIRDDGDLSSELNALSAHPNTCQINVASPKVEEHDSSVNVTESEQRQVDELAASETIAPILSSLCPVSGKDMLSQTSSFTADVATAGLGSCIPEAGSDRQAVGVCCQSGTFTVIGPCGAACRQCAITSVVDAEAEEEAAEAAAASSKCSQREARGGMAMLAAASDGADTRECVLIFEHAASALHDQRAYSLTTNERLGHPAEALDPNGFGGQSDCSRKQMPAPSHDDRKKNGPQHDKGGCPEGRDSTLSSIELAKTTSTVDTADFSNNGDHGHMAARWISLLKEDLAKDDWLSSEDSATEESQLALAQRQSPDRRLSEVSGREPVAGNATRKYEDSSHSFADDQGARQTWTAEEIGQKEPTEISGIAAHRKHMATARVRAHAEERRQMSMQSSSSSADDSNDDDNIVGHGASTTSTSTAAFTGTTGALRRPAVAADPVDTMVGCSPAKRPHATGLSLPNAITSQPDYQGTRTSTQVDGSLQLSGRWVHTEVMSDSGSSSSCLSSDTAEDYTRLRQEPAAVNVPAASAYIGDQYKQEPDFGSAPHINDGTMPCDRRTGDSNGERQTQLSRPLRGILKNSSARVTDLGRDQSASQCDLSVLDMLRNTEPLHGALSHSKSMPAVYFEEDSKASRGSDSSAATSGDQNKAAAKAQTESRAQLKKAAASSSAKELLQERLQGSIRDWRNMTAQSVEGKIFEWESTGDFRVHIKQAAPARKEANELEQILKKFASKADQAAVQDSDERSAPALAKPKSVDTALAEKQLQQQVPDRQEMPWTTGVSLDPDRARAQAEAEDVHALLPSLKRTAAAATVSSAAFDSLTGLMRPVLHKEMSMNQATSSYIEGDTAVHLATGHVRTPDAQSDDVDSPIMSASLGEEDVANPVGKTYVYDNAAMNGAMNTTDCAPAHELVVSIDNATGEASPDEPFSHREFVAQTAGESTFPGVVHIRTLSADWSQYPPEGAASHSLPEESDSSEGPPTEDYEHNNPEVKELSQQSACEDDDDTGSFDSDLIQPAVYRSLVSDGFLVHPTDAGSWGQLKDWDHSENLSCYDQYEGTKQASDSGCDEQRQEVARVGVALTERGSEQFPSNWSQESKHYHTASDELKTDWDTPVCDQGPGSQGGRGDVRSDGRSPALRKWQTGMDLAFTAEDPAACDMGTDSSEAMPHPSETRLSANSADLFDQKVDITLDGPDTKFDSGNGFRFARDMWPGAQAASSNTGVLDSDVAHNYAVAATTLTSTDDEQITCHDNALPSGGSPSSDGHHTEDFAKDIGISCMPRESGDDPSCPVALGRARSLEAMTAVDISDRRPDFLGLYNNPATAPNFSDLPHSTFLESKKPSFEINVETPIAGPRYVYLNTVNPTTTEPSSLDNGQAEVSLLSSDAKYPVPAKRLSLRKSKQVPGIDSTDGTAFFTATNSMAAPEPAENETAAAVDEVNPRLPVVTVGGQASTNADEAVLILTPQGHESAAVEAQSNSSSVTTVLADSLPAIIDESKSVSDKDAAGTAMTHGSNRLLQIAIPASPDADRISDRFVDTVSNLSTGSTATAPAAASTSTMPTLHQLSEAECVKQNSGVNLHFSSPDESELQERTSPLWSSKLSSKAPHEEQVTGYSKSMQTYLVRHQDSSSSQVAAKSAEISATTIASADAPAASPGTVVLPTSESNRKYKVAEFVSQLETASKADITRGREHSRSFQDSEAKKAFLHNIPVSGNESVKLDNWHHTSDGLESASVAPDLADSRSGRHWASTASASLREDTSTMQELHLGSKNEWRLPSAQLDKPSKEAIEEVLSVCDESASSTVDTSVAMSFPHKSRLSASATAQTAKVLLRHVAAGMRSEDLEEENISAVALRHNIEPVPEALRDAVRPASTSGSVKHKTEDASSDRASSDRARQREATRLSEMTASRHIRSRPISDQRPASVGDVSSSQPPTQSASTSVCGSSLLQPEHVHVDDCQTSVIAAGLCPTVAHQGPDQVMRDSSSSTDFVGSGSTLSRFSKMSSTKQFIYATSHTGDDDSNVIGTNVVDKLLPAGGAAAAASTDTTYTSAPKSKSSSSVSRHAVAECTVANQQPEDVSSTRASLAGDTQMTAKAELVAPDPSSADLHPGMTPVVPGDKQAENDSKPGGYSAGRTSRSSLANAAILPVGLTTRAAQAPVVVQATAAERERASRILAAATAPVVAAAAAESPEPTAGGINTSVMKSKMNVAPLSAHVTETPEPAGRWLETNDSETAAELELTEADTASEQQAADALHDGATLANSHYDAKNADLERLYQFQEQRRKMLLDRRRDFTLTCDTIEEVHHDDEASPCSTDTDELVCADSHTVRPLVRADGQSSGESDNDNNASRQLKESSATLTPVADAVRQPQVTRGALAAILSARPFAKTSATPAISRPSMKPDGPRRHQTEGTDGKNGSPIHALSTRSVDDEKKNTVPDDSPHYQVYFARPAIVRADGGYVPPPSEPVEQPKAGRGVYEEPARAAAHDASASFRDDRTVKSTQKLNNVGATLLAKDLDFARYPEQRLSGHPEKYAAETWNDDIKDRTVAQERGHRSSPPFPSRGSARYIDMDMGTTSGANDAVVKIDSSSHPALADPSRLRDEIHASVENVGDRSVAGDYDYARVYRAPPLPKPSIASISSPTSDSYDFHFARPFADIAGTPKPAVATPDERPLKTKQTDYDDGHRVGNEQSQHLKDAARRSVLSAISSRVGVTSAINSSHSPIAASSSSTKPSSVGPERLDVAAVPSYDRTLQARDRPAADGRAMSAASAAWQAHPAHASGENTNRVTADDIATGGRTIDKGQSAAVQSPTKDRPSRSREATVTVTSGRAGDPPMPKPAATRASQPELDKTTLGERSPAPAALPPWERSTSLDRSRTGKSRVEQSRPVETTSPAPAHLESWIAQGAPAIANRAPGLGRDNNAYAELRYASSTLPPAEDREIAKPRAVAANNSRAETLPRSSHSSGANEARDMRIRAEPAYAELLLPERLSRQRRSTNPAGLPTYTSERQPRDALTETNKPSASQLSSQQDTSYFGQYQPPLSRHSVVPAKMNETKVHQGRLAALALPDVVQHQPSNPPLALSTRPENTRTYDFDNVDQLALAAQQTLKRRTQASDEISELEEMYARLEVAVDDLTRRQYVLESIDVVDVCLGNHIDSSGRVSIAPGVGHPSRLGSGQNPGSFGLRDTVVPQGPPKPNQMQRSDLATATRTADKQRPMGAEPAADYGKHAWSPANKISHPDFGDSSRLRLDELHQGTIRSHDVLRPPMDSSVSRRPPSGVRSQYDADTQLSSARGPSPQQQLMGLGRQQPEPQTFPRAERKFASSPISQSRTSATQLMHPSYAYPKSGPEMMPASEHAAWSLQLGTATDYRGSGMPPSEQAPSGRSSKGAALLAELYAVRDKPPEGVSYAAAGSLQNHGGQVYVDEPPARPRDAAARPREASINSRSVQNPAVASTNALNPLWIRTDPYADVSSGRDRTTHLNPHAGNYRGDKLAPVNASRFDSSAAASSASAQLLMPVAAPPPREIWL